MPYPTSRPPPQGERGALELAKLAEEAKSVSAPADAQRARWRTVLGGEAVLDLPKERAIEAPCDVTLNKELAGRDEGVGQGQMRFNERLALKDASGRVLRKHAAHSAGEAPRHRALRSSPPSDHGSGKSAGHS